MQSRPGEPVLRGAEDTRGWPEYFARLEYFISDGNAREDYIAELVYMLNNNIDVESC